jgi:hypothetical protein
LADLPFIVPTAALGYSLLLFWNDPQGVSALFGGSLISPGWLLVVLLHFTFSYPVVVRVLVGALLDYKKEYEQQVARGEHERRMERQRGRRSIDKIGNDANGNGKADRREGKDVAHVKALDKGGSNKNGLRIQSVAQNRSFKRDSKGNLVSETSKKERKRT